MFPFGKTYRLYVRGGAGICCYVDGVSLGPIKLVERSGEVVGKRYHICSAEVLAEALTRAYGPLPGEVMVYLARGIFRVTQSLEDGNVALAMIKAVHLKFPEIQSDNMSKLNMVVMAKYNPNHDERGRFTSGPGGANHSGKKTRRINQYPGGPNGTVMHFVNDNPHNPSPDQPVSEETAKMIEDVVGNSGLKSVTINSTTGGRHTDRIGHKSKHYSGQAVDIDNIDGYSVGDIRNREKVRMLQDAFQRHPNIAENFGPAYLSVKDKQGNMVSPAETRLAAKHRTHIHVAGEN